MPEPNIVPIKRNGNESNAERPAKPTRFLSLRQVLDRTSISRSLIYQLIKDETRPFPAPVHIGRRSVWIESEIEAYLTSVIQNERRYVDGNSSIAKAALPSPRSTS